MLTRLQRGQLETRSRSFDAVIENVPGMSAFAEDVLDGTHCPVETKRALLIALDEVANNVASYSGASTMALKIECAAESGIWRFAVSDDGVPWNPLNQADPDVTLPADERKIGGLGIFMVRNLMDDVSYAREGEWNVLRFVKRL